MDTIFIYNPSSCRKKSFQILKFRLLLQFQIKILLALVQKKPLEIRTSWSSCMSGTSQSCNNVIIAVLYKLSIHYKKSIQTLFGPQHLVVGINPQSTKSNRKGLKPLLFEKNYIKVKQWRATERKGKIWKICKSLIQHYKAFKS